MHSLIPTFSVNTTAFNLLSLPRYCIDDVLFAGNVQFHVLGRTSLSQEEVIDEARPFNLEYYGINECTSLNEARVKVWESRMRRSTLEPPKLCSLPPTDAAFKQNVLRDLPRDNSSG